jgi:hypothetical protein
MAEINRAVGLDDEGARLLSPDEAVATSSTDFSVIGEGLGRASTATAVAGLGLYAYNIADIKKQYGSKAATEYGLESGAIMAGGTVATAAAWSFAGCAETAGVGCVIGGALLLAGGLTGLGIGAKQAAERDKEYKAEVQKRKDFAEQLKTYSDRSVFYPKGVSEDDVRRGYVGVYDESKGGYVMKPITELTPQQMVDVLNNDNNGKYTYSGEVQQNLAKLANEGMAQSMLTGKYGNVGADGQQVGAGYQHVALREDGTYTIATIPPLTQEQIDERADNAWKGTYYFYYGDNQTGGIEFKSQEDYDLKFSKIQQFYKESPNAKFSPEQLNQMADAYMNDSKKFDLNQLGGDPDTIQAFADYVDAIYDQQHPVPAPHDPEPHSNEVPPPPPPAEAPQPPPYDPFTGTGHRAEWNQDGGESFHDFLVRYNTPEGAGKEIATE